MRTQKPERDRRMKLALKRRLVNVIQDQGQVKFHLAPIGLKLGERKPGCDGSMKQTLRTRSVKIKVQGQGQVKFHLAPIGPKLGCQEIWT